MVFDLVLIVLFLLAFLYGWRKGIIRTIYNFISFFISIYIARWLYPLTKSFFDKIGVTDLVTSSIDNLINFDLPDTMDIYEKMEFLQELNMPDALLQYFIENNNPEVYASLGVDRFEDYFTGALSVLSINTLSILLTIILSVICLRILGRALKIVNVIPVVSTINNLSGAVVQVLIVTIYVWLFFLLLNVTMSIEMFDGIRQSLNESSLGLYLYNHNLIFNFIIDLVNKF